MLKLRKQTRFFGIKQIFFVMMSNVVFRINSLGDSPALEYPAIFPSFFAMSLRRICSFPSRGVPSLSCKEALGNNRQAKTGLVNALGQSFAIGPT